MDTRSSTRGTASHEAYPVWRSWLPVSCDRRHRPRAGPRAILAPSCGTASEVEGRWQASGVTAAVRGLVMADDRDARIARLEEEVATLRKREATGRDRAVRAEGALEEALEQQAALAEVLRVIASSPTDLYTVLMALVGSAMRLCGADTGSVLRV